MATVNAKRIALSTEVASKFVENYYAALNTSRETIGSFYLEATTMTDGKSLPVILFNGNSIEGPTAMQTLFKEKMPESHYEVQSYDCHVLNANYVPQGAEVVNAETGQNMVLLVTVNGNVRYGDIKATLNPERKGFSDNIVLAPKVPNPAEVETKQGKPAKEWLIQSQNFRLVV